MRSTITVVIVTYNGRHLLEPCLRALFAGSRLPDEVIAVDNASNDDTVSWLARTYPSVRVDRCAANLGFAAANNRAIRASAGTFVLTRNNDTEIAPDALATAAAVLDDAAPNIGAVMPVMVFAESPDIIACAGLESLTNGVVRDAGIGQRVGAGQKPYPIFGPSAGAALYRRAALDDVGLFDPAFFMYLEDADLAWRLRLRGWDTLAVPHAIVQHKVSATAGYGSPRKAYYLARNRWWCLLKNLPTPLLRRHASDLARYDAAAIAYATLTGDRASLIGRRDAIGEFSSILRARAMIQSRVTAPVDDIATWLLPSPLIATLRERHIIRELIKESSSE
jgi:GT2 family glycosyltransferase